MNLPPIFSQPPASQWPCTQADASESAYPAHLNVEEDVEQGEDGGAADAVTDALHEESAVVYDGYAESAVDHGYTDYDSVLDHDDEKEGESSRLYSQPCGYTQARAYRSSSDERRSR